MGCYPNRKMISFFRGDLRQGCWIGCRQIGLVARTGIEPVFRFRNADNMNIRQQ